MHVNDNIYYIRTADPDERSKWTSILEAAKVSTISCSYSLMKRYLNIESLVVVSRKGNIFLFITKVPIFMHIYIVMIFLCIFPYCYNAV